MPFDKKVTDVEEKFYGVFNEKYFQENFSKEDFNEYLKNKEDLKCKKGFILFEDGEPSKGVYLIKKGTLKLSKSGVYGKDHILRFISQGDMVGYRSILCGENFQAKAEAMTDVELSYLPQDVFLRLLEHNSNLSFAMLQKIAHELGEYGNTITFLAQKTVRERLAEILLLLEKRLGTDMEGFIKISLTREEIANLIGTATESAIRLISEFKQDSLIDVEGRNIRVKDRDKLRKISHIVD